MGRCSTRPDRAIVFPAILLRPGEQWNSPVPDMLRADAINHFERDRRALPDTGHFIDQVSIKPGSPLSQIHCVES